MNGINHCMQGRMAKFKHAVLRASHFVAACPAAAAQGEAGPLRLAISTPVPSCCIEADA